MKKVKNTVFLGKPGNLRKRIRFATTFSAKIIFERTEMWMDGCTVYRKKIGKSSPICCHPKPESKGLFICDCGKHLGFLDGGEEYITRVIVELPESLITFSP